MNGFRKMQERLLQEGWLVAWNMPCCQSCAWSCLPDELPDGTSVDLDKALFNHSQDCEIQGNYEDCVHCDGTGVVGDKGRECEHCHGDGSILSEDTNVIDPDCSVSGFVCNTPETQDSSMFCFGNAKTLKAILPIIEECGCSVYWDGSQEHRIEISWSLK